MDTQNSDPRQAPPRGLIWYLSAALIVCAVMALVPLRAQEAWWYLAIGRLIDAYQAVPDQNHLLYSVPADKPSFILEWLSSRALYGLQQGMGIASLVAARNLALAVAVVLSAIAFVWRGAKDSESPRKPLLGALAALTGFVVASWGITATPILFVAPLFALLLLASVVASNSKHKWALPVAWVLFPATAALWANLDVSAFLPALLALWCMADAGSAGVFSVKQARLGWLASSTASILALMANPRGADIYGHIATVHTLYPGASDLSGWAHIIPMTSIPGAILTAGVILLASAYGLTRTRPALSDLSLAVVLFALAMSQQRGMLWFGLAMPVMLAPALVRFPRIERLPDAPAARWQRVIIGCLLLLAMIPLQPVVVTHAGIATALSPYDVREVPPHQGILERDVPLEVGEFLAQTSVTPRIWASPRYEPYLIYRLSGERPTQVVFSDPRRELLGEDVLKVRALVEASPDLWRGMFQGWGVSTAVLSKNGQHAELIAQLKEHPNWMIAHQDAYSIYFVEVRVLE